MREEKEDLKTKVQSKVLKASETSKGLTTGDHYTWQLRALFK